MSYDEIFYAFLSAAKMNGATDDVKDFMRDIDANISALHDKLLADAELSAFEQEVKKWIGKRIYRGVA